MAFLDKLQDMGKAVQKKSEELAESGKISVNIMKKEKDIRTAYSEIGKYVYDQFKAGQAFDDKVKELCDSIDAAKEEILALQEDRENIGIEDLNIEIEDEDAPAAAESEMNITEEDEKKLEDL